MASTAASSGPDWAPIMTAVGTVLVAAVAVWVAWWTDRRSGQRIREERKLGEERLKAEHERSDRQLREEHQRSDRQLEDERAYSRAQIDEERRIARDREQWAEAYAVQVVPAELPPPEPHWEMMGMCPMAVMVVNHGKFTITGVEARFSPDGTSVVPYSSYTRLSGFLNVPKDLRGKWNDCKDVPTESAMEGVLTPWDTGIRFESTGEGVLEVHVMGPYPLVRWTDRWGTRWEHRRGEVRQVRDDDPWAP